MAIDRALDAAGRARLEPVRGLAHIEEERRVARSPVFAAGTLACPRCDAPVAPGAEPMSVTRALECPFCAHEARVRDFLSLGAPTRPARVEVRVGRRPLPVA